MILTYGFPRPQGSFSVQSVFVWAKAALGTAGAAPPATGDALRMRRLLVAMLAHRLGRR